MPCYSAVMIWTLLLSVVLSTPPVHSVTDISQEFALRYR